MKQQLHLVFLFLLTAGGAFGQAKLVNIQENGLWAPANVRIDGNLPEWNNNFGAYNKTTKLFYSMANDSRYIYLAVKSTDATNNAKIAAGGITLTINTSNKKKDKDAFVITYPVITRTGGRGRGGRNSVATDSASVQAAHQQLVSNSKEIKVIGFTTLDDTLISIYNLYSIKAAIGYDKEGNYNYELAVPLQLLGLTFGDANEFAYQIKVNGLQVAVRLNANGGGFGGDGAGGGGGGFGGGGGGFGGGGGRGGAGGGGGRNGGGGGSGGGNGGNGRSNIDFQELTSPSDFWGKYTLAKK